MEWDDQFFIQPRLTSKLKHLVLRHYVKEFVYHLGSVRPRVYYVDGFAGAGIYKNGESFEDGSPLMVAKMAVEIKNSPRPFDLCCINVEANPKRYKSLDHSTKPFRPQIVEENFDRPFVDVVPEVLAIVKQAPAFFFIDPFGTKDIPFKKLLPVFRRPHTTEVLITLHTDGIAKKAGWFGREDDSDAGVREMAGKFTGHLAEALDVPVSQLRQAWSETGRVGNTNDFENRALEYYLKKLRASGFRFTKAFKVLYYQAGTLRETPICFHLVFATRHEKGLFKMNDAMFEALDDFYRDVYSGSFFPQFASELDRVVGAHAVRQEILASFSAKLFTIDDVKRRCMQEKDYLLKGSEYRKLVLRMASEDELLRVDVGTPTNGGTRFQVAGVNK